MNTFFRDALGSRWVQWSLYRLIRLYSRTFYLSVENETPWLAYVKSGGRVLLCTWHQQFFSAIRHFKSYSPYYPALMISQSRDGDIIAGVARQSGWNPVRGSSSRGGKSALEKVVVALRTTGLAGHILDGPRGPAGSVKPGAIRIALDADAVIVPFFLDAENAWYFNSWDHFFIPKPFSRVVLRYGPIIRPEPDMTSADFELLRLKLETLMRKELK